MPDIGIVVKRAAVGIASAGLAAVIVSSARASCSSPANPIEAENCLPGTPNSVWEPPASDTGIEGFATQSSVNPGSTLSFKIHSAAAYTLSIYRMGYYGGNGARLVTTLSGSAQTQPACLSDTSTGLVDCGNWTVSASWNVPAGAVSGIYFVELKRSDTGGGNIFSFVVRNDSSHSAVVVQAQDTTQQAYNNYGGNSLYIGNPAGRAYKVSFNRPPVSEGALWDMFTFEQPMIRWLERNGYDVSYISGVDTDRNGALLLNHKLFMTNGHDEYWSAAQRANVEAARDAGVNLAFFSGNTMYWKTRWENSIDGSNTDHRTLVCYKETTAGRVIDPLDPPISTGLWADPAFGPPADGDHPQSADTGSAGNVYGPTNRDDPMTVLAADGKLRFWRNTALANMTAGTSMAYAQMLGYEWDQFIDNGVYPAGIIRVSTTTLSVPDQVGLNTIGNYSAGQAIHRLVLYRAASGALVFGAGTMQWGWYLDPNHDSDSTPPAADSNIQQATVNLFADMGVQPATLQSGLVPAVQSADTTPPVSIVLTAPQTFTAGALATVSGTAADSGGGVVGGVEVSTNNGANWHPAEGRSSWTYSWKPATTAFVTPMSRATDDSGNLEGRSGSTNPMPTLSALSPSSATIGSAGFTLSAAGSNFVNGAVVRWNGANLTTSFVNSSELNATIPASDLAVATTANVTVLNPAPGGGTSSSVAFVVGAAANPAPILASISPSSAAAGGLGFNLGVTGSSFVSSSTVLWNGSSRATVFVSSTQLAAAINTADLTAAATASVTVFNPGPGGGTSTAKAFIIGNPVPILAEVSPSSGAAGSPGFSLVVAGSNFITSSTVLWNGVSRATVFLSSTQLTAAILTSDLAAGATAGVTVINSGPGGGASTAASFLVLNPSPSLAALSLSSAAAGGLGFNLGVNGSNFVSSSTVLWNGGSRATVFVSSTLLSATILAGDLAAPSLASVAVFNPGPGGGTSNAASFSVDATGPPPPAQSLFYEPFNYPNGLITNEFAHFQPTSTSAVVSSTWDMTSGSFFADGGAGWTGIPDDADPNGGSTNGTDSSIFHLTTKRSNFGDVAVLMTLNQSSFVTTANTPSSAWDGVSVVLRLTSETSYYYMSAARRDNTVVIKKVSGTTETTLVSALHTAALGSPQQVEADVHNSTGGAVTLRLAINGAQLLSFVDSGTGGAPLISSGAVGMFGSNANFHFGAFTVNPYSMGPAQNPVPSLTSLSPSSATTGSPGFTLALTGSNFISSSTVLWNGLSRATVFVSSGQLNAQILSADLVSATTAAVAVFSPGPGGGASGAQSFLVTPSLPGIPTLASISPSSAAAGGLGFTLNAFGGGFVSSSTVLWNGSSRTTVFVSSGQLSVQISTADLAASATAAVTVLTPAPGGGTSAVQTFLVYVPNPVPAISSIAPSSAPAGTPGLALNVLGANFVSGSTVLWNGASRVTVFVSSGQLSAQLTIADLASATTAAVTVLSPGPGGGASVPQAFFVTPPPPGVPMLASISPSSAAAGGLGFTLTAFGGGFVSSSAVMWNGSSRATVFVSSAQLSVQIGTGDLSAAATAAVAVFTPSPGGGTSATQSFLVYAPNPVPSLSSIAPSSATAGTAGLTLSVFGAGFVSGSTVRWNNSNRSTVFVSSAQLNAQILTPDLASSTTSAVTVFSPGPGGGTSGPQAFIVSSPPPGAPALASISPSSAAAGGLSFTLNAFGGGFVSSSTVMWNGSSRATVFVSSAQLSVQISTGDLAAAATAAVTVFTRAPGGGVSAARTFLVYAPNPLPVLASISPLSATAGSAGLILNLTGSSFISSSTVLWNGASRATVFISSTQLSASIQAGDLANPTTAQVTVSNPGPGGGTSTASGFLVSPSSSTALFVESFGYPNGLITNELAHWDPTSTSVVISSVWDMLSGSFFAENGLGWTGVPDDVGPNGGSTNGTDSSVFQLTTKRNNFGDVSVSMALNQQSFVTTANTPSEAWDGVSVVLRYSATSYYYVSASRRDNTVVLKKVAGATQTTLASASHTATLGSPQRIEADVQDSTSGAVTLTLKINGAQLIGFVDSGTGGAPITASGAVGVFGDNANFYFGSFTVAALGSTGVAALQPIAPVVPLDADLSGVRIFPNPWRSDRHQGVRVTIDHSTPGSELRIFAISGRWLRTISMADGTGAWDLTNDAGRKVASGVYLYLITDGAGHRSRGTLAVIQ